MPTPDVRRVRRLSNPSPDMSVRPPTLRGRTPDTDTGPLSAPAHAWQPPADVQALVAAGHLVMVEPGLFRRRWPDPADLQRLPSRAEVEQTSTAPTPPRGGHR